MLLWKKVRILSTKELQKNPRSFFNQEAPVHEYNMSGFSFRCCASPSHDPYREEVEPDCCYYPGCTKTPFADYAALFGSTNELFDGGDAILVIYTCKEHNTSEFQEAKRLLLKDRNKRYPSAGTILCTRDELDRHARGILGDRAARMSRGVDTAF